MRKIKEQVDSYGGVFKDGKTENSNIARGKP